MPQGTEDAIYDSESFRLEVVHVDKLLKKQKQQKYHKLDKVRNKLGKALKRRTLRNRDSICITPDEAEAIYEAIKNKTELNPAHITTNTQMIVDNHVQTDMLKSSTSEQIGRDDESSDSESQSMSEEESDLEEENLEFDDSDPELTTEEFSDIGGSESESVSESETESEDEDENSGLTGLKGLFVEQNNQWQDNTDKTSLKQLNSEQDFINPYQSLLIPEHREELTIIDSSNPNFNRHDPSEMCEWSILSEKPQYLNPTSEYRNMHVRNPSTNKRYKDFKKWKPSSVKPDFQGPTNENHFLDVYENIYPELNSSREFNEASDISTTYLGRNDAKRSDPFRVEMEFPFNCHSRTMGRLPDGTPCNTLLDTGGSKSFMSYDYYKRSPYLRSLPTLACRATCIELGDGKRVPIHFAIPMIVQFSGHVFEILTLVANIKDELVFGIKNMYEVEGNMCTRDSAFKFMNRAVYIFPTQHHEIKPGAKRFVKIESPFFKELSGSAITKMIEGIKCQTVMVTFTNNKAMVEVANNTDSIISLTPNNVMGTIDLRSLGYFHVRHDTLTKQLSNQYHFESLNKICEVFNENANRINKEIKEQQSVDPKKLYPWLEDDDPRLHMTDEEILEKFIDLSKSDLTKGKKKELLEMIIKYKKAFSLRDDIGECPNFTIDIDVIDKSPFFVRPFPISEQDKPYMDRQMKRLVSLGILTKNSTSHTSPVMLITRKLTKDKRAVSDLRLLNSRIRRKNTTTILIRDIFNILGNSKCDMMSCVDIKDAFHSIRLKKESKEYCGILPYFGSDHYRYEVLPMGLSVSPAIWMSYVNFLLDDIKDRTKYIAIMDDMLVHSLKGDHFDKLETLFKTLIAHGLKLSPKKCQLCLKELVYMGNVFKIEDKRITIRPMKSRIEAMLQIPNPTTPKQCKSFCGVVNYLAMFCPDLQRLLAPIYALTRKGAPFVWTKEHQTSFDEIKRRLTNPPVLNLPIAGGKYILYTDTSRKFVGSALWQVQKGTPKLIGYASKTLHKACANYSVTELEMQGMLISILLWQHFLHNEAFDCAIDHQAAYHIMRSKTKPATSRIQRLLEHLSHYCMNVYYVKGKDLILADFLSRVRQPEHDDPYELIPVSCDTLKHITEAFKGIKIENLNVSTRSTTRKQGITLPDPMKMENPHKKPEHQRPIVPTRVETRSVRKVLPRRSSPANNARVKTVNKYIKQGRTKSFTKRSANRQTTPTASTLPEPIEDNGQQLTPNQPIQRQTPRVQNNPSGVSQSTDKVITDQTVIPKSLDNIAPNNELGIDLDQPFQEEMAEPHYSRPSPDFFNQPVNLADEIDEEKVYHKFLPKQIDIDKLLDAINRKVLRHSNFPDSLKDIQSAYLSSPHFRDIYLYLRQNKLPTSKRKVSKLNIISDQYMVLDTLLFKINATKDGSMKPLLCIPTSKVDVLLQKYHSSLAGGHAGVTKCYHTISQRFYCPNLAHHIRAYITGCHVCQMFKVNKKFDRPFQKRVNINTPALTKLSMDIKHMPRSKSGYKFILVLLCEVSNFIVCVPLKNTQATTCCKAIMDNFIRYFGSPTHITCDLDPAFTSSICQYFMQKFDIKMVTVSPTNHKSLLAEHGIKSLSNILKKHLEGLGKNWEEFLGPAMLCYNTYTSPNLDGLSPFELVLGRLAKIIPELEQTPEVPVTGTFSTYLTKLKAKLKYFRQQLQSFRDKKADLINKDKEFHFYSVGQLVYLYQPKGAILQTGSRKITCHFVGPLVIYKALSPNQFILMSLDGIIYPHLIEETRIKPGYIRTTQGNVTTLSELKQVIRTGSLIKKRQTL